MKTFLIALLMGTQLAFAGPLKFSEVARRAGLEYLMIPMSTKNFARLVQKSEELRKRNMGDAMIQAMASNGFRDRLLAANLSLPIAESISQQMLPLLEQDQGKYAHGLISSGDFIAGGVRIRSLRDWRIGLVFPVTVLDRYSFKMTDMRPVSSRRKSMSTGLGDVAFSSAEKDSAEFKVALEELIKGAPFPDSLNANRYFEFHFNESVAASELAFLWIPQPLLQWFQANPSALTETAPEEIESMLEKSKEVSEFRISIRVRPADPDPKAIQDPEIDNVDFALIAKYGNRVKPRKNRDGRTSDWADIAPLQAVDGGVSELNHLLYVGQWFETIPNWAKVEQVLSESPIKRPTSFHALCQSLLLGN